MDNSPTLNKSGTDAARSGLLRLHDAVGRREPGRPEAALSPDELLSKFRTSDPTRNAAYLPWLLRTYAAGGYRLEDLSKAHDTLAAFARLRGYLPNTATVDGEVRNPRKLGSHMTLASLWKAVAPLIEAELLAQENKAGEQVDTDRERALSQSRVLHRSARMVIAVPLTEEASCWWGQGTQWCTAARNDNVFEQYHSKAPLIVICLRKNGDLPARKLQLHLDANDMQFMDENDADVSPELISERWQDLEALVHWAVGENGSLLACIPEHLCTEALCLAAVCKNGEALDCVPEPLRAEAICTVAVGKSGWALEYVPEPLRTEAICTVAVGTDGYALIYVPEHLRTEEICAVTVGNDGRALQYVPEHIRTEAICTVAVGSSGMALEYVPEPLRTEEMCLAAVGRHGRALQYVPVPLCTKEICLAAVCSNGFALAYVPEPLRTEAICLAAVEQTGRALAYVPNALCTEEICTDAVGRHGWALEYVPKPLRTEEMCLAAVTQDGGTLEHVPQLLRTEAVCLAAVNNDRFAINHVPGYLRAEITQLATEEQNKQKSSSVTDETNERKSYELVLSGLENCLNNLQPSYKSMFLPSNLGMN